MRSIFFSAAIFATLLFFVGCDNQKQQETKKEKTLFENNTEPNDWIGGETIKERPNAHSGKSVSITDTVNQYSLGFCRLAGTSCEEKIKKITFSYWVLFKNASCKANSVLSIDAGSKNIYWHGTQIQDRVKGFNKWVQIIEVFDIPVDVEPEHTIKLYVWNTSKEEVLVDDLQISFN